MRRIGLSFGLAFVALLGLYCDESVAADEPSPEYKAAAEKRFNELLEKAKADPSRTNWKMLRVAYTETDRYQPYSRDWRNDLAKVHENMDKGDLKSAEKVVASLRDKEGWTRLDVLMTAETIYDKLGDKKAEELHHRFIEGFLLSMIQPGRGQSATKPFEVIYIDEEYLILNLLDEKRKVQELVREGEHYIDVQTTEPKDDKPSRKYYFNVDIPRKRLESTLLKQIKANAEAAPAKK